MKFSAEDALETPENRAFFIDYDWLASQYRKTPAPAILSDYGPT